MLFSPKMTNQHATTKHFFPNLQYERAFFQAASKGDASAVKRLIAAHVNVDCTPYQVLLCTYILCELIPHTDINEPCLCGKF